MLEPCSEIQGQKYGSQNKNFVTYSPKSDLRVAPNSYM